MIFLALGWVVNKLTNASVTGRITDAVTQAEFDQLQEGMSYEQCVKIIGEKGKVVSSTTVPDFGTGDGPTKMVMISWENSDGGSAMCQFDNGILKMKTGMMLP